MNKLQLVEKIMEKTNLSKGVTEKFINNFIETVSEALAEGEKVQLIGFGTFETRKRAARVGHNPQTGDEIKIGACIAPAFKPGKPLKDIVNK